VELPAKLSRDFNIVGESAALCPIDAKGRHPALFAKVGSPSTGEDAGYPSIAMQLISGKPLHLAQQDMSLFEQVQVIQQVADAMHAAHRQGLIHRDIKPSTEMHDRDSLKSSTSPRKTGGEVLITSP